MPEKIELADDRVRIAHDGDSTTISFDDGAGGRACGECTLCCKLLPIPGPPLHKPANTRCIHQKAGKGCTIYPSRPFPCRVFACRWLADNETAGMRRPDRAHYVIDLAEDYVTLVQDDGQEIKIGVIQIWVDPGWRDAWRAPELRRYMLRMAERRGMATIVRFSSFEAVTVFAPPLTSDGQWHEETGRIVDRTAAEAQVLAEARPPEGPAPAISRAVGGERDHPSRKVGP